MKRKEQASSFYFMSILIFILVVAFQCLGYYLILNGSYMKVYPEFEMDINAEKYYILVYYVISFFTLIMSGWGIASSFAAAKSSGVIRSYVSYLFALVHFVVLIIIVGSLYLSFTDMEGLRDLIQRYIPMIPLKQ